MKKIILLTVFSALFAIQTYAAGCEETLTTGDSIKFDKSSITVPKTCKTFKINLLHTGKSPKSAMGHNVVVVPTADVNKIGIASASAGLANDYVPKNDKIVASSKLIGGGEKTSLEFDVSKISNGSFSFVCTFPGHWAVMKGTLKVE